ncbi:MAG: hypothetical protein KDA65_12030 [Planctomycetaceae bacterium]|nr:hypothetical protein [Planctomycetaceae bacterium]
MITYSVRLQQYQTDWHITVGGHRNAVKLRDKLRRQGIAISRLQELDGTANYSFRIPRNNHMDRFRLQKLLGDHCQVRLVW